MKGNIDVNDHNTGIERLVNVLDLHDIGIQDGGRSIIDWEYFDEDANPVICHLVGYESWAMMSISNLAAYGIDYPEDCQ